ncbi:tRNA:m(4)X modification enzyme TRM13 homolog isoform X2 [Amphiprion ocellaris]|uniref:tRNA:m(4)X modification enzyme TRM13 n=2 Tax=Amphiprion ocellaris TaxID=80972 RepID=A0A3Q1BXL1_AMPOC|nr:tRNA:m(4)X modification enzyme TRM13 homolog isoform X2 [Amphiprion ocellaris]
MSWRLRCPVGARSSCRRRTVSVRWLWGKGNGSAENTPPWRGRAAGGLCALWTPNMTEDKLQKHLKKCNSREKPKPVYFVENINAGSADGDDTLHQVSLSERSRSEMESLLDKLKTAVEGLQCDLEDRVLSHLVLHDELNNPKNGDSAHKHLKQQSSILGHLEELGLLGRGRCFVEFGAGRGKLSHWIHEALKTRDGPKTCDGPKTWDELKTCDGPKTCDELKTCDKPKTGDDLQLLLVERCSTRFKVDGKHQEDGVPFERLQVDIQHLDLSKVPLLRQRSLPLVGVGKHLCGAATDLALRCLLETPGLVDATEPPQKRLKPSEPAEPRPGDEPGTAPADSGPGQGSGSVLGLAVALCCHHRCEWRHYVGQQFFLQRGLGAAEFSAFCRMSSWATCGLRPTSQDHTLQDPTSQRGDDDEHEPAEETDTDNRFVAAADRQQVGRLCKLLIDCGRRHYLKTKGFSSKLSRYVSTEVTLENVLLTAVPSSC